jgi:5'-nucleotidase
MVESKVLNILHFNDVYNIEERKNTLILGGARRFCQAFKEHGQADKLCLFSGDLFFPSTLSQEFAG